MILRIFRPQSRFIQVGLTLFIKYSVFCRFWTNYVVGANKNSRILMYALGKGNLLCSCNFHGDCQSAAWDVCDHPTHAYTIILSRKVFLLISRIFRTWWGQHAQKAMLEPFKIMYICRKVNARSIHTLISCSAVCKCAWPMENQFNRALRDFPWKS